MSRTDDVWILVGSQTQFQTVMRISSASSIDDFELVSFLPEPSVFDSVSTQSVLHKYSVGILSVLCKYSVGTL